MITITNMTTNGNFEWDNEIIKVSGTFSKSGDVSGELNSIYCNFADIDSEYQGDNANVYFNGGVPSYNINSANLTLLIKFINSIGTLISELNNTDDENQ